MSKESTRDALSKVVRDVDLAARVAAGDFTEVGATDLTDHEQALLQAAAAELAEDDVSGFAMDLSQRLEQGITLDNGIKNRITLDNGIKFGPGVKTAFDYLTITMEH